MWTRLIVLSIFATAYCSANIRDYNGYKVYRVTPENHEHLKVLTDLETSGVLFWEGPNAIGRNSDLSLSPFEQQSGILKKLTKSGMNTEVFIDDMNQLIQDQQISQGETKDLTWDQYYQLADIHSFVDEIAAANPSFTTVLSIGNSTQGRDLKVIKISQPRPGGNKPVIFLDANIHAREWVTSAVATFLIKELITSQDPNINSWINDFEWYILPMVNPDGFVYTHTTDRMWRKSRSRISSSTCYGVDLNRNFDYHWREGGSSTNPCAETFAGERVSSDPETVHIANFIDSINNDLALYISLHSYSQYIMFPYGDSADIPQYDRYMDITRKAADAIKVRYNTTFLPGNWLDILYLSTGTSMDYVQSKNNRTISITYELRDQGRYGFLLPANQIEPSALEFIDSLHPIINELRQNK